MNIVHKNKFWGALMVLSLLVMAVCGSRLRQEMLAAADAQRAQTTGSVLPAEEQVMAAEHPGEPGSDGTALPEDALVQGEVEQDGENSSEIEPGMLEDKAEQDGESPSEDASGALEDKTDKAESGVLESEDESEAEGLVSEDELDVNQPMIALTFDDGPYTPVTNRILDALIENGAKATFFVVGSRLNYYSDTLKRVYDSGCEIGNHSYSHANLNSLTADEIREEITSTEELIHQYADTGSMLVRPPYGNANETVRNTITVPMINWSLDSQDWKSRDADAIIEMVLTYVKDGDIILMHDLYESTAEAAEYLIPELIARGYRLVTVSELFEAKKEELVGGCVYRNASFDLN